MRGEAVRRDDPPAIWRKRVIPLKEDEKEGIIGPKGWAGDRDAQK